MDIDAFLENTIEIDSKRNYWYVRTESGDYFNTFWNNKFIAIGWNEITVNEIKESLKDDTKVREKIAKLSVEREQKRSNLVGQPFDPDRIIDLNTQGGKREASMIIKKLQNFYNLKFGDVVVIPSYNSNTIAFGIINDYGIDVDNSKSLDCEYYKRRKVIWKCHRDFKDLDKPFYALKYIRHAISSVKDVLAENIDRVMNDYYFKDGSGHIVLKVNKEKDIKASDLFKLGGNILALQEIINKYYNFDEQIDETIVKLNVQSKGEVFLKQVVGNSILGVLFVLSMLGSGCKPDEIIKDEILTKREIQVLQDVKENIDSLDIKIGLRDF